MRLTPCCYTLDSWLVTNLGKGTLAPLTPGDRIALATAVHAAQLYSLTENHYALTAYAYAVQCMQPETRELAYHAIAHVSNWEDRAVWWELAGLAPFPTVRLCNWEPGGKRRAQ